MIAEGPIVKGWAASTVPKIKQLIDGFVINYPQANVRKTTVKLLSSLFKKGTHLSTQEMRNKKQTSWHSSSKDFKNSIRWEKPANSFYHSSPKYSNSFPMTMPNKKITFLAKFSRKPKKSSLKSLKIKSTLFIHSVLTWSTSEKNLSLISSKLTVVLSALGGPTLNFNNQISTVFVNNSKCIFIASNGFSKENMKSKIYK